MCGLPCGTAVFFTACEADVRGQVRSTCHGATDATFGGGSSCFLRREGPESWSRPAPGLRVSTSARCRPETGAGICSISRILDGESAEIWFVALVLLDAPPRPSIETCGCALPVRRSRTSCWRDVCAPRKFRLGSARPYRQRIGAAAMNVETHNDCCVGVGFDAATSARTFSDRATNFRIVIPRADERAASDRSSEVPSIDAARVVRKSSTGEENRLCNESVSCTFAGRPNTRTSEVPGHEIRLAHLVTTDSTT
jgi:hypothetical protein